MYLFFFTKMVTSPWVGEQNKSIFTEETGTYIFYLCGYSRSFTLVRLHSTREKT